MRRNCRSEHRSERDANDKTNHTGLVAGEAADQGHYATNIETGQPGPSHREDSSPSQVDEGRIHRISVSGRVTVEGLPSSHEIGRRLHVPSVPRKPADIRNNEGQKSMMRSAACNPNPRRDNKSKDNSNDKSKDANEERRRTTGILLRRTALDSFSIPLHPQPTFAVGSSNKDSPEPSLSSSSSSSSSSTPLPAPLYSLPHGPWKPAPFNLAFRGAAGIPTTGRRMG